MVVSEQNKQTQILVQDDGIETVPMSKNKHLKTAPIQYQLWFTALKGVTYVFDIYVFKT